MAFKFDIKSVIFAGLLFNGCAPETPDPSHPAKTTGNATAETKDAGAAGKADAGASATKDAGKKDAGSADKGDDSADDSTQDDTADETASDDSDDSTKPTLDAGKADAGASTTADAGGAKADAGGGSSSGDTCADLTYEKFGKTFLDTYCLTCHTKMMPTFTTLAQVVTNKVKIKAEAATGTAMPPKGSKAPTADERTTLGKWIDCGPK